MLAWNAAEWSAGSYCASADEALGIRVNLTYDVDHMDTPAPVGQFEQLVLTAILKCGDNAYGVTIHASIEELQQPRPVTLGAVYATLDRLEEKGLISSWLSDPTPQRGGRAKRHFRLEADGERALRESALMARRVCDTIEGVWGEVLWSRKWKVSRPR